MGRPKKVKVAPIGPVGNLSADQIKMLSEDSAEPVKKIKKQTIQEKQDIKAKPDGPKIWMPEPSEKKKFIRDVAVSAFLELVKHNGKINNDWASIVTTEAKALADKLDF